MEHYRLYSAADFCSTGVHDRLSDHEEDERHGVTFWSGHSNYIVWSDRNRALVWRYVGGYTSTPAEESKRRSFVIRRCHVGRWRKSEGNLEDHSVRCYTLQYGVGWKKRWRKSEWFLMRNVLPAGNCSHPYVGCRQRLVSWNRHSYIPLDIS